MPPQQSENRTREINNSEISKEKIGIEENQGLETLQPQNEKKQLNENQDLPESPPPKLQESQDQQITKQKPEISKPGEPVAEIEIPEKLEILYAANEKIEDPAAKFEARKKSQDSYLKSQGVSIEDSQISEGNNIVNLPQKQEDTVEIEKAA